MTLYDEYGKRYPQNHYEERLQDFFYHFDRAPKCVRDVINEREDDPVVRRGVHSMLLKGQYNTLVNYWKLTGHIKNSNLPVDVDVDEDGVSAFEGQS